LCCLHADEAFTPLLPDDDDAAPELVIPLAPPDTLRPLPERGGVGEGGGAPPAPPVGSTALFHAIAAAYTLPGAPGPAGGEGGPPGGGPPAPPYAWHARFSHLASYGGGYYTYSYAAAFSADVWGALFAADPFSRASGERWRREVLARGAADDPASMLAALLGRPPSLGPLLRELGLLPPRRAA